MSLLGLVGWVALAALVVHLSHWWSRFAFVVVLGASVLLVLNVLHASSSSLDILGVTLALQPAPRDFLLLAFALTGALALAFAFEAERAGLSFLFWSWLPWMVALMVNNFVVAVFAWMFGLILPVLAMRPRRPQRASGAAYYLALITLAGACLILANRLVELYPLTPERTGLIQLAVLFLCWGLGILLGLVPFQLWVGPMTDDAPLPIAAAVLGLGQPIGLWLLFNLLNQNLWLTERSALLTIVAVAGVAAVVAGGLLGMVERRAGRLLGYAALLAMGFVLLDLSQASPDSLVDASLELAIRALGLTALAVTLVVGRRVENPWARRVAMLGFLLAALSVVGIRLGVSLYNRWGLLTELAASNLPLAALLAAGEVGLLVGFLRFFKRWVRASAQTAGMEAELAGVPRAAIKVELQRVAAAMRNGGEPARTSLEARAEAIPLPAAAGPVAAVPQSQPAPNETSAPPQPAAVVESVPAAEGTAASPPSAPSNGKGERGANPLQDGAPVDGGRDRGEGNGAAGNEYDFEEHVGEIAREFWRRAGPHVRSAARRFPAGTRDTVIRVLRCWQVWASIGLVVGLILALLAAGVSPEFMFNRAASSLGHPLFVK